MNSVYNLVIQSYLLNLSVVRDDAICDKTTLQIERNNFWTVGEIHNFADTAWTQINS